MTASVKVVHAGSGYDHYLTNDASYYTGQGDQEGDRKIVGAFDGEGAVVLGLSGEHVYAGDDRVKALMKGLHPRDWSPMRRSVSSRSIRNKVYRPVIAVDIVGSPPPDVTALYGAGDHQTKERIQKAIDLANRALREHTERIFCFTRTGAGGRNKEEAKAIWASFPHVEDRAGMPQPHVHNLLFTTVHRKDGKWGAADLRPLLKREAVFELGQVYRNALRNQLSVEFEASHLQFPKVQITNGYSFSIRGFRGEEIPKGLMKRYSPRSEAIWEALQDISKPSAEEVQKAVLKTRPKKPLQVDQQFRVENWRRIAKEEFGFTTEAFLERSRSQYIEQMTDIGTFFAGVKQAYTKEERQESGQKRPLPKRVPTKERRAPSSWQREAAKKSEAIRRWIGGVGRGTQGLVPEEVRAKSENAWRKRLTPLSIRGHIGAMKDRFGAGFLRRHYSYGGAVEEARADDRRRARWFRAKMGFLYLTYQIDYSTYQRYMRPPRKQSKTLIELKYWTGQIGQGERLFLRAHSGHELPTRGVPKSRLAINFSYATGQITRSQQLLLLKKHGHIKERSPEIRVRRPHRHTYE